MDIGRRDLLAGGAGVALGTVRDGVVADGSGPVARVGSSSGSYQSAGASAVVRFVQDRLGDYLSVLDYVPEALHADIRAGRSTTDISRYVQSAIDEHGVVYFPAGRYVFNVVFSEDNRGLVGQAVGRQSLGGEWEAGTVFLPADHRQPLIKCDPMAAGRIINFITLRDFLAFGFNDGPFLQTNGDSPTRRTDYVEISNVFVHRFGHGLDIRGGGLDWRLTSLHVFGCALDGVHIDTGDSACNGWMWTKCSFTRNGRHGWYGRKTRIAVEVSYSHTFLSCGSEYNGIDAGQSTVRGWVFENYDLVQMLGCTGEENAHGRERADVIDVEFTGTTARNILIDGFQSIMASTAIRFGATLQSGSVRNVRAVLRPGRTVSVDIQSSDIAPDASPKLVVDRYSVSGDVASRIGRGGRHDLIYADGTGPADVHDLDAGWTDGKDAVLDLRNRSRLTLLAKSVGRVYRTGFANLSLGAEYTVEARGREAIRISAAIMQGRTAFVIAPGTITRFMAVDAGEARLTLRPLWVSPAGP